MNPGIQAIRGMHDILPDDARYWQRLEDVAQRVLLSYGYQEIRTPVVEKTELFQRSVGAATDIVEKEMYSFVDRNGDSLCLRPEATASCVRAGIQAGLLHNQVQRWWYMGPMFRRERPQKGRYRQFYQIGVEVFGPPGPDVDVEVILLSRRMWRNLGFVDRLELQINSIGSAAERHRYREELVTYFSAREQQLDADSRRRLHTNPLRILDSKNLQMQALISAAPKFSDFLGAQSRDHFQGLRDGLDGAGVTYTINPHLVRGLDYYSNTVFEWVCGELGAQSAVCAGGRYDGLVEHLGGRPTPGVGFAMGLERLVELLRSVDADDDSVRVDAYLVLMGEQPQRVGMALAETLRNRLPDLQLLMHCGGGGFKSQFKRADRSGAEFGLIFGEDELARGIVGVKSLRKQGEQTEIERERLPEFLARRLSIKIHPEN